MRYERFIWIVMLLIACTGASAQYDSTYDMQPANPPAARWEEPMLQHSPYNSRPQEELNPVAPGSALPDNDANTSSLDEPPPFGGEVDDSGVPVDGGLSLLITTGLGLGGRMLKRRRDQRIRLATAGS